MAGEFVFALTTDAMMVSPTALEQGVDLKTTAVGAGPYEVVNYVPEQVLELQRKEDHWDAANWPIKTITIRDVDEGAPRATALIAGDIQFARMTDAPAAASMQGQSGLEVLAVPSDEVLVYINPCKSEPPYDDPDVRRAWTMAIDRDALTAVATEGLGEPAPGIWPTGSEFSNPDAQRTYDPDGARELLAGSSPEVVLTFPSALPYLQTTAEIIQQQLNDVGFSATLRPAANTEEIFSPETKMLLILGGFPWSNRVARQLGPDSGTNICTYSDPKFDELNGALKATSPDDPAAKDLWYEMEQLIYDEELFTPLYFNPSITAFRSDDVVSVPFLRLGTDFRFVYVK